MNNYYYIYMIIYVYIHICIYVYMYICKYVCLWDVVLPSQIISDVAVAPSP